MDFTSLDGVVTILHILLNTTQKTFGVMNTGEVGEGHLICLSIASPFLLLLSKFFSLSFILETFHVKNNKTNWSFKKKKKTETV